MRIALLMPEQSIAPHEYFRPFLTTGGSDIWNGAKFIFNPSEGAFDAVVVHQSTRPLTRTFNLSCPPSRTLLVVKEPPDILTLPDDYTRQFHLVLSQDPRIKAKEPLLSCSAHHWYVEVPVGDVGSGSSSTEKTRLISAVVSAKTDTVGHRKRLKFMEKLKARFGNDLDWFGRGVREIGSRKLRGLSDYKYHVVLENGVWPHYWTEKLADAYVANCVPLYSGAPNISDYFQPDSMVTLNMDDIKGSIDRIETAVQSDMYSRVAEQLATARNQVFFRYHPYEVYSKLLKASSARPPIRHSFKPHTSFDFSFAQKMRLRARNLKHKVGMN